MAKVVYNPSGGDLYVRVAVTNIETEEDLLLWVCAYKGDVKEPIELKGEDDSSKTYKVATPPDIINSRPNWVFEVANEKDIEVEIGVKMTFIQDNNDLETWEYSYRGNKIITIPANSSSRPFGGSIRLESQNNV